MLDFSYSIPVAAGSYTVKLHFAEAYWRATGGFTGTNCTTTACPNKRKFDVNIEGGPLELDNYDIAADVGPMTAVIKTFDVAVTDGQLSILFDATAANGGVDRPSIAAIEVFPGYRWDTRESFDEIPYSHHPYAYALSNPVLYTDPTGKYFATGTETLSGCPNGTAWVGSLGGCIPIGTNTNALNPAFIGDDLAQTTVGNFSAGFVERGAGYVQGLASFFDPNTYGVAAKGVRAIFAQPRQSRDALLGALGESCRTTWSGLTFLATDPIGAASSLSAEEYGGIAFDIYSTATGVKALRGAGRARGAGAFADQETFPYTPEGNVFGQKQPYSCVAAGCKMLLNDPSIPEAYLRAAAGITEEGGKLSNVPSAISQFNTMLATKYIEQISLSGLEVATRNGPAMVFVRTGTTGGLHAIVIDGFESGLVKIRDPLPLGEGSAYQVNVETFVNAWDKKGAVVVTP